MCPKFLNWSRFNVIRLTTQWWKLQMKDMEKWNSLWCWIRQLPQLEDNLIHSCEKYFVCSSYETVDKALYTLGVYGVQSNLHPSLKKLTSNGSKTIIIESNLIGFWRAFIFATQELQLHSLSHNKIHDHLIHANYHQHVCSRVLFLYRIFLNMKETNKCCAPTLCQTICWMGFLFYSHSSQLYYSPSLFMRKQRPI